MGLRSRVVRLSPVLVFLLLTGCSERSVQIPAEQPAPLAQIPTEQSATVVAEGVILYAQFAIGDGSTGGFSRLSAGDMPANTGRWNVDAHGRLTDQFLVITYPQEKNLGPHVIPTSRLIDIQFGDGGITDVNADERAPVE